MSDREAVNMIFAAGLSTADAVTNVSGRGVGMDVVRTNIERIGGQVDITSEVGRGTTVKVKIPLTLAIIPALTVWSSDNRYAIPQVSLLELVRLEGDDARAGIEYLDDAPVYRLRGRLLPLVRLSNVLGETSGEPEVGASDAAVNIVVLQADDSQFGLIVDNISDTEEIVVKPLGKQIKNIQCFAGATIMGDGRVALILDVLGCAQEAGILSAHGERIRAERELAAEAAADNRQSLLVVGVGADAQAAVPLSHVARLDQFPMSAIEHAGGVRMVQYRDEIVPLVDLAEVVSGGMPLMTDEQTHVSVVVSKHRGRSVGLVVDRILDIVETELVVDTVARRHGVLGTMVVQGKVTELVDLPTLSADLAARLFTEPADVDVNAELVTVGAGA
jgi:two-component system chemotaxis sensor kinase CheA